MLRLLKMYGKFSRSRARRQMTFDKKLKDFTMTQESELQIDFLRDEFNQQGINPLSETLSDRKAKLGKKFEIDRNKLQKTYKQKINLRIQKQNIQSMDDQPEKNYALKDKSHLYDQKQEIDFQQQFRKQLFRAKQIQLLLNKQKFNPNNYIPGKQNTQYLQYEALKNQLKNNKIQSMMGFKNTNEQLKLLIQSGLINEPHNLKKIIDSTNQLIDQTHIVQIQNDKQIQANNQQIVKIQQKETMYESQINKNDDKIRRYLQNYNLLNKKDKQENLQFLEKMKQIKVYQQNLFNSRYQAINFRYKGQVQFTHFTQRQLIGYIKTHQIQPLDLITMYHQNKKNLNKINYPVITPPVLSTIYAKTSLYKFPQNDENNRINMLNDPKFIAIEKHLFKNISQLDNNYYTQAVSSYANNHQEEQGLLKPKMNQQIQNIIFSELNQRINSLQEQDLGLVLRSLVKMALISNESLNWDKILTTIKQKLPKFQQSYQIQSTLNFVSLLPTNQKVLQIVSSNISLYGQFKWEYLETLTSFLRCSSVLLRYDRVSNGGIRKWTNEVSFLISQKQSEIVTILPKISINNIPHLLTIIEQCRIKLPIIVNNCKKLMVQNIRQQKQQINQSTISSLALSIALIDYSNSKDAILHSQCSSLMSLVTMKAFMSFRVFNYNSIKYFPYHELAHLSIKQLQFLTPQTIAGLLLGCSMVNYKNQPFYDELVSQFVRKLQVSELNVSVMRNMLVLVRCFYLQRRTNILFDDLVERIFKQGNEEIIKQISPNQLLNLSVSLVSVVNKLDKKVLISLNNIGQNILLPYLQYLQIQNVLSWFFTIPFLNNQILFQKIYHRIKEFSYQKLTAEQKYIIYLVCHYFNQPAKIIKNIQQLHYKTAIQDFIKTEQMIGSQYPYNIVYSKISDKLRQEFGQIIEKQWVIEVPTMKKAYFIATYEHLGSRFVDGKISVTLYGIWKIYPLLYFKKGWEFQIICTFLEGSK